MTPAQTVDDVSVNRYMDTNKGTSVTSLDLVTQATTSNKNYYFSRFVSDPLDDQSLAANTWTYYFGGSQSNSAANFPVSGNNKSISLNTYTWRPSTQTRVTILATTSAANFNEILLSTGAAYPRDGTYSGSSATVLNGDVLVFEVWFPLAQQSATSNTVKFYYDGTNDSTTEASANTNTSAATYIETPQTLVFAPPPGPSSIDMTPNSNTITNKFITKI